MFLEDAEEYEKMCSELICLSRCMLLQFNVLLKMSKKFILLMKNSTKIVKNFIFVREKKKVQNTAIFHLTNFI